MHLVNIFIKKGFQFRHKLFELLLNVSKVLAGSCIALEQQIIGSVAPCHQHGQHLNTIVILVSFNSPFNPIIQLPTFCFQLSSFLAGDIRV